ncbi:MAG: hypothetical protein LBV68_01870 [Spirochaetaceae bacterium]|jgi:hypothetical protein|nr:hypothetical protein [Spirochaetaceae bacterium]
MQKTNRGKALLKIVLALVVIAAVCTFLLPSRCKNETQEITETAMEPSFDGHKERAIPDSEIVNEADQKKTADGILPAANGTDTSVQSSTTPGVVDVGKIVPAERLSVIGETEQEASAIEKTAHEAEVPKEAANTDSSLVPATREGPTGPGGLKIKPGGSTENAAPDSKSARQRSKSEMAPHSTTDRNALAARELPPLKGAVNKSIEAAVTANPEGQKTIEAEIKNSVKNEVLTAETKPDKDAVNKRKSTAASDSGELVEESLGSREGTGEKAHSQASPLSIGLLCEGNKATRQGWTPGAGLIAGYEIRQAFTVGVKGIYGNDLRGIEYFEGLLYGRYYLPYKRESWGIFAQLGLGGITFTEMREKSAASVLMDISLGARFTLGNFYLEPYIRGGYMIEIGAGLAFGYRLEG